MSDGPHRIQASIRPHLLDQVVEALDDVGVRELVAVNALGFTERACRGIYRGVPHLSLNERVLLDVVTHHHAVELVVELIARNAWTGFPGDGTVWAMPLERAVDIRTGTEHSRAWY